MPNRSLLSCALASLLCLPAIVTSCGKTNPLNDDDLPASSGGEGGEGLATGGTAGGAVGGAAGMNRGGRGGAGGSAGGKATGGKGGSAGRAGGGGRGGTPEMGGEAGEAATGGTDPGGMGGTTAGTGAAGNGGTAAAGQGGMAAAGQGGTSGTSAGTSSGTSGSAGTAGGGPVDPCNPDQVGLPTNIAVGKAATANKNNATAGLAIDGDMATLWTSGDNALTNWWMVDLGQRYLLAGLRTTWEYGGVVYRYYVETSANGVNYATVIDRTAHDERLGTFYDDFPEATCARFVRIRMTEAEGYWMLFKEVEVEALLPE